MHFKRVIPCMDVDAGRVVKGTRFIDIRDAGDPVERDAHAVLDAGADKVSVNSAAVARPDLLDEMARVFGAQCVVLAIDAKRRDGGWEVFVAGGRSATGRDAV